MKKILMIILDGLGDRPYKELGGNTPLEYAKTPNFDMLASKSSCGLMYTLGVALRSSSDVAHMTLFGLDHKKSYTGRGPIELYGLGKTMEQDDLAFRGNFAVIDKNSIIIDRRAGRAIPSEELLDQIRFFEIDGVRFELLHVAEHRFVLHVHGVGLSNQISDSDPHIEQVPMINVHPLQNDYSSIHTAELLNKYIFTVNNMLAASDYTANCILLRGGGSKPEWFNFQDRYHFNPSCIANNALYNGIGRLLGMKVMLTNHFNDYTEYYSQIHRLVEEAFCHSDFVFLHIQEADLFGEDGNVMGKVNAIEQMDRALHFLNSMGDDYLITVAADHSTPCVLKAHSGDPVPIMIYGDGLRYDDTASFGERFFAKGSLGIINGCDFMPILMNAIGKAELIGG